MSRLPITTKRRDIDVKIISGQSIFDLHQQIQILLKRESPQLSNFFAEPLVNSVRGEINWNTRAVGSIKSASDFSNSEWESALIQLKANTKLINEIVTKLETAGRSKSSGTQALQAMLMTPDLAKSLFLVGNELVLTQWGCHEFGTDAKNADLFEQIEKQPQKTQLIEPEHVQESSPVENVGSPQNNVISDPDSSPIVDAPSAVAEPQTISLDSQPPTRTDGTNFFWRWLILLLLLILLLIGLIWKYWSHNVSNNETVLRTEITELWTTLDKKIQDCPPSANNESNNLRPQMPVSTEEFSTRQSENQIKPNSKVNVSLAWNNQTDLDLIVLQPDGHFVSYKPCEASTCGSLDVDANLCNPSGNCRQLTTRPLENISWPGKMLPGKYVVSVRLYSINSQKSDFQPIAYTVQITQDGDKNTFQGLIRAQDIKCEERCSSPPQKVTEFTIKQ